MIKTKAEKVSRELKFMKFFGVFFFVIAMAIAVAVPHIFKDYDGLFLNIKEDYLQSLVILFEGTIAYVFYMFYRNKMNTLLKDYVKAESNLEWTYKHIGKINNELDLVKNFIASQGAFKKGKKDEKKLYKKLLAYMLVSVVKVNVGFIRFINIETGKTVSEYHYSGMGISLAAKLSNNLITRGIFNKAADKNMEVVESYYQDSPIRCVLCFPKSNDFFDVSLLKLFLTQIHLMFLAQRSQGSTCQVSFS
jgi:hypothetical protein